MFFRSLLSLDHYLDGSLASRLDNFGTISVMFARLNQSVSGLRIHMSCSKGNDIIHKRSKVFIGSMETLWPIMIILSKLQILIFYYGLEKISVRFPLVSTMGSS